MAEHFFHGDLRLGGSLVMNQSLTGFPDSPRAGEMVVKDGIPYFWTQIAVGFYSWMPMSVKQSSHVHSQGVASSQWTISHNLGVTDYGIFIYDQDHSLVIANSTTIDANTIRVDLYEPITGTAVVFGVQNFSSNAMSVHDFTISGDIIATGNGTQDIGSPTNRFRAIYVDEAYLSANTLYLNGKPVLGTVGEAVSISSDAGQSVAIHSDTSVSLDAPNIGITGDLTIKNGQGVYTKAEVDALLASVVNNLYAYA
jgi:hypothetical protein